MKRTAQETEAAVKQLQKDLKAGKYKSVGEGLKKAKIATGSWQKYRKKRNPYTKREPSVEKVTPIETEAKGKWFVITNDEDFAAKVMKGEV